MHPLTRRRVTLAALAAWLAAAPALAKDTPTAVPLDAGFQPAAQAAKLLQLTEPAALKGLKRVAVPQFTVEFITSDSVSSQVSSFGMAGRSSVTGFYKLVGVAEPDFQAMAESVYASFVRDLQASGLEVVPPTEIAAAPAYRKMIASATPLPLRGESSITVGPPGTALYGMARATVGTGGSKGLLGALSGLSNVASAIGSATDNVDLQKELGDAALLEVTMRVHFAQLADENRGFLGRMGMSATVSAKVHAAVTTARLTALVGPRASTLTLSNPLLMDSSAFSDLRKEAKSAGDVAGAVAVGLLRAAIGSKDSHSSDTFEAVADTARYREVVGGGLAAVGTMFTERLKAER